MSKENSKEEKVHLHGEIGENPKPKDTGGPGDGSDPKPGGGG